MSLRRFDDSADASALALTCAAPAPASACRFRDRLLRPTRRSAPARANTPARSRSARSPRSRFLISRRYGSNGTTPRPGGRSPWTLPSQSDRCTWPTRPLQPADFLGRHARQHQVRDVDVGLHVRQIHVVQKADHRVDVVDQRQRKRLQLEHDFQAQLRRPAGPTRRTASTPSCHCSAGGITSRFQMYSPITSSTFLASILVGQVEIRPHALDVKRPHAGIEVDQAHGHAGQRHDRQPQAIALVLDQPPLADVERPADRRRCRS